MADDTGSYTTGHLVFTTETTVHWRPIATAPKDGTAIMGWRNLTCYVARQDVVIIHWTGWGGGTWETQGGAKMSDYELEFWAPLPAPPYRQGNVS